METNHRILISHGCLYEKGYIIIPEIKLFSVLFWWNGTKKCFPFFWPDLWKVSSILGFWVPIWYKLYEDKLNGSGSIRECMSVRATGDWCIAGDRQKGRIEQQGEDQVGEV